MFKKLFFTSCCILFTFSIFAQKKTLFNKDWEFIKDRDTSFSKRLIQRSDEGWLAISLPHTANLEPIEKKLQQWQGICFYRKFFSVPLADKGKYIALQFDAAMQEADVYVNGKHVYKHLGGYLPFYVEVSKYINYGKENNVLVRLDNRNNAIIPPGKPLADLDFNYYSGIYRNVFLIKQNPLRISDPISPNRIAGGGVLIHWEDVKKESAVMNIRTDIFNGLATNVEAKVRITLMDKLGNVQKAMFTSESQKLGKGAYGTFKQRCKLTNPWLWSPDSPSLYSVRVELIQNDKVLDTEVLTTGIKGLKFVKGEFSLNGQKVNIRGTNRHQEYPYLGNALSDRAQYRDAVKIKEAGFNFVRSSHYPQSPAFLDACDELGIMVMDAIPGWQFFGNAEFQKNSIQDVRDMIRRDRNHPSIILWEPSLNESAMSKDYMKAAHTAAHEEMPFPDTYTSGWIDDVYDVYVPARQHAKAPDYWKKYSKDKPILIAEYGDWEYYAQNAGFEQKTFKDLKQDERTSRQLRGSGAERLLQQALNFQESHNDNLYGPSVGDANWLMFDYKRGYADDIESSGIMDIMRLPKFSFYFYQSQRDAGNKPMLYIANYWNASTDSSVTIYSNCTEVELFVNGHSLGKRKPDQNSTTTNLAHPPFTYTGIPYEAGTLRAVGYLNQKEAVVSERKTPGTAVAIRLRPDYSEKQLVAGQNDILFIYAEIIDEQGTVLSESTASVQLNVKGDAEIVGSQTINAEAGIATFLLKAGSNNGTIQLEAQSEGLKKGIFAIKSEK
ncbi:glycoside hydrolase family 2 protein [Arcticibacter eurypsychrophilus]|uniref:glycoside hydrolase family 2 protein n=1 Tax=Arcticibacter eurypsychrophilus TaxID=1434752 RepID=UPI00084DBC46|nr:glycoside hydrolase family 2 TIM barrel-domain containing protein [Arcticibacter eurypsychrophilus]